MIPKAVEPQTDFSGGEIDISAKRSDDPALKTCARQMSNWRILNTKKAANRPGRSVRFLPNGTRVEKVPMSPGVSFYLEFGNGTLRVLSSAGAQVFSQSGFPWTTATIGSIVWAVYRSDIYIAFTATQPNVLTWDGVSTWSVAAYAEQTIVNQKRTPFYRISKKGVTMSPSGASGSITLTFSEAIANASMIGTRMRFMEGPQLLITAFTDSTHLTATAQQTLPATNSVTLPAATLSGSFAAGDAIVAGGNASTGARGIVVSWTVATGVLIIQMYPDSPTFSASNDVIVGPNGTGNISTIAGVTVGSPGAVQVWDEEIMNTYRGWPQSVFVDQNRLGFCNFQSLPAAIVWSANGSLTDLYPGANPADAIVELAPDKSQVLYVVPGMESSEFVFCDNAVYYIPITPTNPLKPGSVGFQGISSNGTQQVQPRRVKEAIVYISAGNNTTIMAMVAIGSYTRPYEPRALSDQRGHLFNSPICIAAPTADDTFPEDYVYVVNADGTLAVGKYEFQNGQIKGDIGWVPWSGIGTVSWAATLGADMLFTTSYAPNGITAVSVVEAVNANYFTDAAVLVNALPTAMAAPPGNGPLWWIPNGTVDLYDIATAAQPRMMGTYQIDVNGYITPQNNGGENLASLTLVAGQPWTATFEPFIPQLPGGQDAQQRMRKRRIAKARVSVQLSTGFRFDKLYGGINGRNLPATGAVQTTRRVETWNMDDDPTAAPTLREQSYNFRPTGRSDDPRVAVVKDTLGPLVITEFAAEVTV
ncbi:MAG: hypothetical protein ABIO35_08300 [Nitrobacter sp.]